MKKINISYRDFFNLYNLVHFLVSLVIAILFNVIYLWITDFTILNFIDSTFVSGLIMIGIGFLSIASNDGLFDSIIVGFANLFEVFKKNGTKKYDGLYEYREIKKEKRRAKRFTFLCYILSGLIAIFVFLGLYFTYF